MTLLILIFLFSYCFSEELDLYSEKTTFENNVFTFTENLNVNWDNNNFTSKKGTLKYPILEMDQDLCFIIKDIKIYSDKAVVNLENKKGSLFSEHLIHVKEENFDLFCQKLDFEQDQITLINQVLLKFSEGEITSDKIHINNEDPLKKITGKFEGILGTNKETIFTYDGMFVYDNQTHSLSTENAPFFLEDKTFSVLADKASFYLKKNQGLEKVVLLSVDNPVEILSSKINALADTITYLPKDKKYILKSTSNNRVLIVKDQDQISAKEIHIIKLDGMPEVEVKGVCHFAFSQDETKRFKNLLTLKKHD